METEVDKTTITWTIKNFSSLQSTMNYSDIFVVDGYKWHLRVYPKGYNTANYLSLYLRVPDNESLPIGWRRHAKFSLTVVNKYSETLSKLRETQHWFDQKSPCWGFSDMITLTELNANNGFLVSGELTVVVKVEVNEVVGTLDVSEEPSPVMETIDVNGFQVLPSQEESVMSLFESHQDFASTFRPKNQHLKTAYMNVLLSLIQTLRQSPQELSKHDLSDAGAALTYLIEAGFELDWLEKKLVELNEKKHKETWLARKFREMEQKKLTQLNLFEDTSADYQLTQSEEEDAGQTSTNSQWYEEKYRETQEKYMQIQNELEKANETIEELDMKYQDVANWMMASQINQADTSSATVNDSGL